MKTGLQRLARSTRFRWLLVALLLAFAATVRSADPGESDPFWSARAGAETLAGAPLIRPDTWTWTVTGQPWVQNSPAWNVVLGLAWNGGGYWGLYLAAALSIGAMLALSVLTAAKMGARPLPAAIGSIAAVVVAWPLLNARATVVVQALVLAAALIANHLFDRLPTRALAAAGILAAAGLALSAAGNWLHMSFPVMAGLIGLVWTVHLLLLPQRRTRWRIITAAAGCAGLAGGILLGPYSIGEIAHQSAVTQAVCAGLISEWAPVWKMGPPLWWIRLGFALAVLAAGVWRAVRAVRARRLDAKFAMLSSLLIGAIPATLAGIWMVRFLGVGLLLTLPMVLWLTTELADAAHRRCSAAVRGVWATTRVREYTSGQLWVVVLTVVTAVLAPFAGVATLQGGRPASQTVTDLLPSGCRQFSNPGTAAPVVLTRPDVPVWMDGRADFYGRDRLIQMIQVLNGTRPIPEGTTCVLLGTTDPLDEGALARIRTDPGWWKSAEANGYTLWLPTGR